MPYPTKRLLKLAGRVLKDPASATGYEAQELAGFVVNLAPDKRVVKKRLTTQLKRKAK